VVETSARSGLANRADLRGFGEEISASKVFHSPHPGHCPCHFGEAAPQFWQMNTSLDFGMGFLRVDL
jgi:hypothetical protein